jgi:hypothetical protein
MAVVGGAKSVLQLAAHTGNPVPMSDDALNRFARDDTKTLKAQNLLPIESFLRSPLGQLLLKGPPPGPDRGRLAATLSSGNRKKPSGVAVTGLYYLYHGSYVRPGYYAIHLLEIQSPDDNALFVTDILKDNIAVPEDLLTSYGSLIFNDERPQIILESNDYRVGLNLIVATSEWSAQNMNGGLKARFFGMTNERKVFDRHCIITRGTDGPLPIGDPTYANMRNAMIEQTGLFTLSKLQGRHRKAIDDLAKTIPPPLFPDLILQHPNLIEHPVLIEHPKTA